eukprot:7377802-Prymnesium_polylepis.1
MGHATRKRLLHRGARSVITPVRHHTKHEASFCKRRRRQSVANQLAEPEDTLSCTHTPSNTRSIAKMQANAAAF